MSELDAIPDVLTFPPAMTGEAVTEDPLEIAVMRAIQGCDAGLICYRVAADRVGAALVFAPEVPLADAMAMLPLCGVGLQNALGALAPPEVAVHLEWTGGVRVNGASCGGFHVVVSDADPDEVPLWLVIGFEMPLLDLADGGLTPDRTALYAEGCADVDLGQLVESWARHSLNWISRWDTEGTKPLHAEWRGLAHGIGEEITIQGRTGTFLGVDERFGMLLRDDERTHLIPLTVVLEDTP
ncbi:biotin/lipoate--protein ligase family protein [Citreimonas salinaria]|uniref:Biotin-(Acetyl-CoA carboxylase) ligase n=1 Tax=Citreimonas salinaria TaxID=321339 RepID=A0A1H3EZR9_9RHOB|nr:biotin/lipoate--protein ligase family protein [Citreimonas salinaria]SDX84306.1 Biotin-(acetyl-CoA carboxylase) ligase [Citreimonas salinaria]